MHARSPLCARRLAMAALGGVIACGTADDPGAAGATASAVPGNDRAAIGVNMDSVATVQRAESLATARDLWNAIEVVSRLEAAGLVVRDLERPVRAPGFSADGRTLAVSGGEMVVFLYRDAAARVADTRGLDSSTASPPNVPGSWPAAPRLITSGNLAAVLFTDREQLAERVRNVLTARHGG